ncbi:MAG: aminoacyl-tRNA hydrolase [Alphaproteobacteria bacterium]|nr:MAG: aminoacyl-tRNA hydrolase [Alphaproteobacteria bacterium]
MLLLVGLGNPGAEYANNRHNIGFMAVDAIIHRHCFGAEREKFSSRIADGRLGSTKVIAQKPLTFMNRSGQAVGEAMRFYKLAPDQVVVFHDDLDLAPGKVRVKKGGGHGGHNGLRSLDAHIGADYWRVRLGIGHPGSKDRVTPYVLGDFTKAEREWVTALVGAIATVAPKLVEGAGAFTTALALLYRPPSRDGDPNTLPGKNTTE